MVKHPPLLVVGEFTAEGLTTNTREVLGLARRIGSAHQIGICLALLGREMTSVAGQGYHYGADQVYMGMDPLLVPYTADAHLQAILALVETMRPMAVLMGHTDRGMDLAPRLAFRLETGIVLDCVDIIVHDNDAQWTFVKPVFGGQAHGHVRLAPLGPQIATIREGALDPVKSVPESRGQVIALPLSLDADKVRMRFIKKETDASLALAQRLAAASVVVCAGRGVKNQAGVDLVTQTAKLLDGAVAASRPVVDNGWLPYALQVGLTGRKVHPQLYIAAGISGAVQHMAGCQKSKTIVAINSDPRAPVFKMAHFGVVGDVKAVLEGFNKQVEGSPELG